jgi:hypothetical protein
MTVSLVIIKVIGGYRATLNNPRTSDEAKAHAQEKIDELTGVKAKSGGNKHHGKHEKETDDEHAHRASPRCAGVRQNG